MACRLQDTCSIGYVLGWSPTAFRHGPVDEFFWRLDRAAFAVDTVLRVDDQLRLAVFRFRPVRIFIHPSGHASVGQGSIYIKKRRFFTVLGRSAAPDRRRFRIIL